MREQRQTRWRTTPTWLCKDVAGSTAVYLRSNMCLQIIRSICAKASTEWSTRSWSPLEWWLQQSARSTPISSRVSTCSSSLLSFVPTKHSNTFRILTWQAQHLFKSMSPCSSLCFMWELLSLLSVGVSMEIGGSNKPTNTILTTKSRKMKKGIQ